MLNWSKAARGVRGEGRLGGGEVGRALTPLDPSLTEEDSRTCRAWWAHHFGADTRSITAMCVCMCVCVKLLLPPMRPRLRAEGDHSYFANWKKDDRLPTVHGPPPPNRVLEYASL